MSRAVPGVEYRELSGMGHLDIIDPRTPAYPAVRGDILDRDRACFCTRDSAGSAVRIERIGAERVDVEDPVGAVGPRLEVA
jgi:hypothetical protein